MNTTKRTEKNPNRVAAGKAVAARKARRDTLWMSAGLTIGIASAAIMQAHALPLWLANGGLLSVAAVMCVDATIIYLAARGGKAAMAVVALGMMIVVGGPLWAVVEPAANQYAKFEAASRSLVELPEIEREIKENAKAVEIMYSAKKVTLAQPIAERLAAARARKAALLKLAGEDASNARLSSEILMAGLRAALIIVMQLSAFTCVRVARKR